MKKLKIAFICNVFPNFSETFIRDQIDYFIQKNHDVDIYAASYIVQNEILKRYSGVYGVKGNLQKIIFFPYYFVRYIFFAPVQIVKSLNFLKYGKDAYSLKLFYTFIFFSIHHKQYDICMCHFGRSGNIGAFLKENLLPQMKLLCMFHGYDIREGIYKNGKKIYRFLFEKTDAILAISRKNRDFLQKWGAENIINHSVGVDTTKFKNEGLYKKFGEEKIKILTVGRLVREKGYMYALEAIKMLKEKHLNLSIQYNIIGAGYLYPELLQYVEKNDLTQHVIFHGQQKREMIRNMYQFSDIFLLSSVSEVLPVAVMEALSCETPVIATNVGSVEEEIENYSNGLLVKACNATAIYKGLLYFIQKPEEALKMAKKGRESVQIKYDINKLNQKLEKIFYTLII